MNRSSNAGRCPKCGGNLYMDNDWHGWYEQCLQCGFTHNLEAVYDKTRSAQPVEEL